MTEMNNVAMTNPATPPHPGNGKSASSVGHMAKAAVAAAREAGVDLPSNAQGLAASQIARGADPASVFAAQIAALAPPPAEDSAAPVDPPMPAVADPAADAAEGYLQSAPAITTEPLDGAATALELLSGE